MAAKKDKRRIKLLKRIAANPRRMTPLVPGRETDYIFEDDPKEVETMRNERHRQNSLAKLRSIDAKFAVTEREYRELRIRILQRMIEEDRETIAKLS